MLAKITRLIKSNLYPYIPIILLFISTAVSSKNANQIASAEIEFDLFGVSFQSFGVVVDDISENNISCKFDPKARRDVFDFLLSRSQSPTEAVFKMHVRDVCLGQYVPLGGERFLVKYRGIGIADLTNKTYSRLNESWIDQDKFIAKKNLTPSISVSLYEADISNQDGDLKNYYAIIFQREKSGNYSAQYAALDSAGYGDDLGNPVCSSETSTDSINKFATSLDSIKLLPDKSSNEIVFQFKIKRKNCESSAMANIKKTFSYKTGKFYDQDGNDIQINEIGK